VIGAGLVEVGCVLFKARVIQALTRARESRINETTRKASGNY